MAAVNNCNYFEFNPGNIATGLAQRIVFKVVINVLARSHNSNRSVIIIAAFIVTVLIYCQG